MQRFTPDEFSATVVLIFSSALFAKRLFRRVPTNEIHRPRGLAHQKLGQNLYNRVIY